MRPREKIKFNRLYWQLSAIFLLVLVAFTVITIYIAVNSARNYSVEVNQKLNWNLASTTVNQIKPNFKNGEVNREAVEDIVHSLMVINPSVEVYLLDPEGKILSYVAPEKVVKLKKVRVTPILKFLNDKQHIIIYGDDPRNPDEKKTFSAAEVTENGKLAGYVYIVLASQEYVSTAQMVLGSYILGLSIRSLIIILLISAVVGLIAIWLITSKLNIILNGIHQFKSGNLLARIAVRNNNELDTIGLAFNEMASTLAENIQELKDKDEFRRELISNISHDLRTPIASIQGYAETLILKKDNIEFSEQLKYLQIIYSSCDRLKKLVSELFELSNLQTNQVKLNPEPFSITELVSDIANKYRIISQKKGISINTFMPTDLPMIEADILLIDRVLQNLIDNALKFCREGDYINIDIRPDLPGKVKITIADTGEGIENEELPYIFERYYKTEKYSESTGLGLAIVKKIIDLHKTNISVISQPGRGTEFSFSLPIVTAA
jgi:signal transduction histidine kinase